MKGILQILLFLMPVFCNSQQKNIDSLEKLLPSAATDSARFQLLYQIGFNYCTINYDSALFYCDKSLLAAQKGGKKLNEASALNFKGFLFNRLQRLTESFQTITNALQIAEDPQNEFSFWNTWKTGSKR